MVFTLRRMKKQKRSGNSVGASEGSSPPITVVLPSSRFDKFKACLDSFATLVLFLTLTLSYWQFRVALRKEDEASTALRLAQDAQKISKEGLELVALGKRDLDQLSEQQKKSSVLAEIGYLTVRAENGERTALERLHQLAKTECTNNEPFMISVAEKNISRILGVFSGEKSTDPWVDMEVHAPATLDKGSTVANLKNPRYAGRAWAVHAIGTLRYNDQIPTLIEVGLADSDLHVIQIVCNTLNKMLSPVGLTQKLTVYDFVIVPSRTKERLSDFWNAHKDVLLAQKPKYWKTVKISGGPSIRQLTDPEAE